MLDNGYVYVLKAANGLYKIGHGKDPLRRLLVVAANSPVCITLHSSFWVIYPRAVEHHLHERFSSKRAHAEWFRLTEEDASSISSIVSEFEPGIVRIREEILELLRLKGWSRTNLASALDVTENSVHGWISGRRIPGGPAAILMRMWLDEARAKEEQANGRPRKEMAHAS